MIRGDSGEYDLLAKWIKEINLGKTNEKGKNIENEPLRILSCEIGVREGMGSKVIMDAFRDRLQGTSLKYKHTGIDPYANLKYQHYDSGFAYTADYTDEMRDQMIKDFKDYPEYQYYHGTDIKYMHECYWREPYHFVHFDGPHMTKDVLVEAIFFAQRSKVGTRFVFDDHTKYEMSQIAFALTHFGFKTIEMGDYKICLEKFE
mgnify:FL=1|tara:strand:+ start:3669 stop:4277 length:609 start_codon:yes stop_codon:yes gene_type:complete